MQQRSRVLPVAYPGARGAYSQAAVRRFFGESHTQLTCGSSAAAIRAVAERRASHAVIPVENSITGVHAGVTEALFEGEVRVIGEVILPIRHCLMGVPETRLEDLAVVTSHPSSLAQCRDWLANWQLATTPSEDTVQAAQDLVGSRDKALAVLGSKELAASYGLVILAEGLSDKPENRTRFFVLADRSGSQVGRRHGLRIGPVSAPRLLKTLRIQLESLGARRVRVPFLGAADGERFIIEFDLESGDGEELASRACASLEHHFLGSWDPDR